MTVVVWIGPDTWQSCVDAARSSAATDEIVLLYVIPGEVVEAARGAFAGLLGRGHGRGVDPGGEVARLSMEEAEELLDAAARRLDRPARRELREGRVEREVVAAVANAPDARLLVVARDGDRSRLGPRSLGPATRFVIDHAPCAVLLVWPEPVPGIDSIPRPPHAAPPPAPPPPPR